MKEYPHKVSGLILYAATDEEIQPNKSYMMSQNRISIMTLDLSQEFSKIAEQLNIIASNHYYSEQSR